MNACPNCGNMNVAEANFCRFCGTKVIVQPMSMPMGAPPNPFDHPTPRPYSWKTDEFQTQNEARRGRNTGYVEGPTRPFEWPNGNNQAAQLAYQQPQNLTGPYPCPRCMTQIL